MSANKKNNNTVFTYAPNSVVGHSTVVAKKFTDKNVVIAGNPAKIIKTDINWRGGPIS